MIIYYIIHVCWELYFQNDLDRKEHFEIYAFFLGSNLSLEELQMQCAPDTILLLDISGSIKGSAYTDLLNFVSDLLDSKFGKE